MRSVGACTHGGRIRPWRGWVYSGDWLAVSSFGSTASRGTVHTDRVRDLSLVVWIYAWPKAWRSGRWLGQVSLDGV